MQQGEFVSWFFSMLCISIAVRVMTVIHVNKIDKNEDLTKYAHIYVIGSLLVGIDYALLTLHLYDLKIFELRFLIILVNLGLITSAIVTLSVWMRAYLAFVIPQLIALTLSFVFNESISVAIIIIVFSFFMLTVARNFNLKFKEGQLLIEENNKLISDMETEIIKKDKIQVELAHQHEQLEEMVAERTSELVAINADLKEEMKIRQQVENELEHLAYFDELTDLPNRTLLIENIKKSLSQAKRNQSLLSVIFVDLDRFKNINDSHGHFVGDKLLQNVSARLKDVLRDSDTIARNGGDEFVILIENMKDVKEPFVVANKIIKTMNNKFNIEEHDIHIGASVGISLYPLDGDEALDLLKMADTAMYEAKKTGRNNFQFYSSAMSNKIKDRLELENALRVALSKDEFFLVFQPQVNHFTQQTTGLEALVRWNSPEFGIVSPFKFVPILEETGLIYSVGEWIILEALNFIKSGKSKSAKVSINLSPLQCSVSNFSSQIKRMINDVGVDPSLVEFEITETLLIDDFSQTEMFLSDISKLGCTIALDDFGTGYTSFSYLTKLPIDKIKIDRSLITGIEKNKNLQDIVRAIVTMSKSLDIENVFEGVETKEELEVITQLNGTIIQGYYFSKPLKFSEIEQWFLKNINNNSDVKIS